MNEVKKTAKPEKKKPFHLCHHGKKTTVFKRMLLPQSHSNVGVQRYQIGLLVDNERLISFV